MDSVAKWFWNDDFWLPPNVTWDDINPETTTMTGINPCNFRDLGYSLLLAWVMLGIKLLFEKKIFRSFGLWLGMHDRSARQMPPTNDVLEVEFRSSKKLDHAAIVRLAKELDMSERKIERWLRQRSLVGKSSKLDKFCESAWKTLYYTTLYTYSWIILWDKKWFWSIRDCWYNFPFHSLTNDVWWYYMIELAYYWSCIISQFFDVQRKDFWEMFLHHIATIGLLVLSFYGFAISWMVTRLGYLPTWIIYSITAEAPHFVQWFPAYNVFSCLLSVLVVLHLFWAYFIFKVAYIAALTPEGKIDGDLRSESASSD
jgi:hypothetical protein